MARRATRQQRRNGLGDSFGGHSFNGNFSQLRRLSLEPLEERQMLAVTMNATEIEVDEGLYVTPPARHSDKIPRLSAFNTHAPNYTASSYDMSNDFFEAVSTGNWSDHTIWHKNGSTTNDTPTNNSFVLIPEGKTVYFNVEMTSNKIFALEIGGTLSFNDGGGTSVTRTLRVGTIYVLPAIPAHYPDPAISAGTLNINFSDAADKANIEFTDYGWGVGAENSAGWNLAHHIDIKHYTGGLIAYGNVDINGASNFEYDREDHHEPLDLGQDDPLLDDDEDAGRAPGELEKIATWAYLAEDAEEGADQITLSTVVDWKRYDKIVLPDTRRRDTTPGGTGHYEDDWTEIREIDSIDYDDVTGNTVLHFAEGDELDYDHLGYSSSTFEVNEQPIGFKPVVGLLTHNVRLYSDDASSTDHNRARAQTLFGGNALVHITFAAFEDLGRTDATQWVFGDGTTTPNFLSGAPLAGNTNNQNGRYAVHFHHLVGPSESMIDEDDDLSWISRFSFVFDGNSIVGSKKWAMALHDSSFGDIRGNVVYDAQGGGIVTEDGSEIGNQIYYNLVTNMTGNGAEDYDDGQGGVYQGGLDNWVERQENSDVARGGSAFWFHRSGNDVVGNVAMDSAFAGYVYTSYYLTDEVHLATRGLDKSQDSENYTVALENPAGKFAGNTVIGKTGTGAWFAYVSGNNTELDDDGTDIGAYGYETPVLDVADFHAFNVTHNGVTSYHATNLLFSDLIVLNDAAQWTYRFSQGAAGFNTVSSYENINVLFVGGFIENMATGIISALGDASAPRVFDDNGTWKYETSYLVDGLLDGAVAGGTTVRGMSLKNWVNLVMTTAAPRKYDHNTMLLDAVSLYPGVYGGQSLPTTPIENPYDALITLDDGYSNDGWITVEQKNLVTRFASPDAQMLSTTALLVKNGLAFYDESGDLLDGDSFDTEKLYQIFFGEQDPEYVIPQTLETALTTFTPQVLGQPGYRTSDPYIPRNNDYLWENYGLAAAGGLLPEDGEIDSSDFLFASNLAGDGPIHPRVFEMPAALPLPTGNARLSLVSPWDGGQLIVPAGESDVQMWVRAQVNGGLKVEGESPLEKVVINWRDTTPGANNTWFFEDRSEKVLVVSPWHTYEIVVEIRDIETPNTLRASRAATVSVIQPHVTAIKLSNNGSSPVEVTMGSSEQLKSVTRDDIDTVSITFNRAMADTEDDELWEDALTLIPVSADASTVTVTDFVWDDVHNIGKWTLSDDLDAGQYFVQLSKDLEDTDGNPLSNGWSNPVSIYDIHAGISAAATDGSVNDDFTFAFTILPGDTAHDNDYGGHNFQYWPLAHVIGVSLTDGEHTKAIVRGSAHQLDPYTLSTANRISIQFDQPMRQTGIYGLGQNSLALIPAIGSITTSISIAADSYLWDDETNTASWELGTTVDSIVAWVHVRFTTPLFDLWGHELDGEWVDGVSEISGHGGSGGAFDFSIIFFLTGDVNNDHTVDFSDLGIVLNNYNQPGGWAEGDLNGDGVVDFADLGIVLNNYNRNA